MCILNNCLTLVTDNKQTMKDLFIYQREYEQQVKEEHEKLEYLKRKEEKVKSKNK